MRNLTDSGDTLYSVTQIFDQFCAMVLDSLEWGPYDRGPVINADQAGKLLGALALIQPTATKKRIEELEQAHKDREGVSHE